MNFRFYFSASFLSNISEQHFQQLYFEVIFYRKDFCNILQPEREKWTPDPSNIEIILYTLYL